MLCRYLDLFRLFLWVLVLEDMGSGIVCFRDLGFRVWGLDLNPFRLGRKRMILLCLHKDTTTPTGIHVTRPCHKYTQGMF